MDFMGDVLAHTVAFLCDVALLALLQSPDPDGPQAMLDLIHRDMTDLVTEIIAAHPEAFRMGLGSVNFPIN